MTSRARTSEHPRLLSRSCTSKDACGRTRRRGARHLESGLDDEAQCGSSLSRDDGAAPQGRNRGALRNLVQRPPRTSAAPPCHNNARVRVARRRRVPRRRLPRRRRRHQRLLAGAQPAPGRRRRRARRKKPLRPRSGRCRAKYTKKFDRIWLPHRHRRCRRALRFGAWKLRPGWIRGYGEGFVYPQWLAEQAWVRGQKSTEKVWQLLQIHCCQRCSCFITSEPFLRHRNGSSSDLNWCLRDAVYPMVR